MVCVEVVMKTAFTFKNWYWGDDYEKQPPQWWKNFLKEYSPSGEAAYNALKPVAKMKIKSNGDFRVVFKSPGDLAFFILRWS